MDLLSKIILDFNDMFGNINWKDADNVQRQILEIPAMVSKNKQYQSSSDHPILVAMEEERRLANRGELGRNQHTKMLITTSKDRTEALYVPHTAAPSRRPKKSNQ